MDFHRIGNEPVDTHLVTLSLKLDELIISLRSL